MPAPLFFIGLPMIMGVVVHLLRRWPWLAALLAALTAALLASLALVLPLDQPMPLLGGSIIRGSVTVLGRAFEIETADRLGLTYLFLQAALVFALAALSRASRYFLSAGLAGLGLLAAALFVRPFLFAALFVEMAAALVVFMLGAGQPAGARGAQRFLVFMTFGMPFILVTGWLLEASASSPADASFLLRATLLLAAGFAIWLAVVPFHSWLPQVAEHAPPLATAFVATVLQSAVVFLMLTFVDSFSWLRENPTVPRALTVAGGGMVLAGSLLAFGQRSFGRSLGYALMVDNGVVLLAVGLNTQAGVEAALVTLALRAVALGLWGTGLTLLREVAGGDDFDALRGLGRRRPLASAAVVFGMLSLIGFPLTAGFAGRWAIMRLLMQIHPTGALLLLFGMLSLGLVCTRGLAALVMPPDTPAPDGWDEPRLKAVLCGLGVVAVLALGAFPQGLLTAVAQTARLFPNFAP